MKEFIPPLIAFILIIQLAGPITVSAQTAEAAEDTSDCKEYGVDYKQTEGLTQEEIRDRMDKALFDSLNKYDECLQQSQSGGGASNSAASGGGAGSEGAEASTSTASTGVQGTETTDATEKMPAVQTPNPTSTTEPDEEKQAAEQKQVETMENGKLPDDIPPSDNDTVLQQKVKEAAMNEPDPEKRAKLWNEYRKLKGLSQI